MKTILSFACVFLSIYGSARALEPSSVTSPDQKFEAVYAPFGEPAFKIVDKATHRSVATLDGEQTGNRGLTASWAPDSKILVVLVEFRLEVGIEIFRLKDGHFDRTEGPKPPEDFLTLGRWTAPDRLQFKGEKRSHTLVLTSSAVKFDR